MSALAEARDGGAKGIGGEVGFGATTVKPSPLEGDEVWLRGTRFANNNVC